MGRIFVFALGLRCGFALLWRGVFLSVFRVFGEAMLPCGVLGLFMYGGGSGVWRYLCAWVCTVEQPAFGVCNHVWRWRDSSGGVQVIFRTRNGYCTLSQGALLV